MSKDETDDMANHVLRVALQVIAAQSRIKSTIIANKALGPTAELQSDGKVLFALEVDGVRLALLFDPTSPDDVRTVADLGAWINVDIVEILLGISGNIPAVAERISAVSMQRTRKGLRSVINNAGVDASVDQVERIAELLMDATEIGHTEDDITANVVGLVKQELGVDIVWPPKEGW